MAEEINVQEKLEEGYIQIRAIIEMLGKPKEHVTETLKSYIQKLSESDDFFVLVEDYSEPEEKEGLFSVFAETEILIKGIENVSWFCFDYMPSSIEIMAPSNFRYRAQDMTNFMNDLLGRLHNLDMSYKTRDAKIKKLNANSEALMKNFLGYLLNEEKGMTLKEISGPMGIPEDNLEKLMQRLLEDNYVSQKGDKFYLSDSGNNS